MTRASLRGVIVLALCVAGGVATAGPAVGAATPDSNAWQVTAKLGGGASASGGGVVFSKTGTAGADQTTVSIDSSTGELVVREAASFPSPGDPCTPAAGTPTTEFRCPPGAVGAIVGNLGGGGDSFIAARNVRVLIGAVVGGELSPLAGDAGPDVIFGGRAGDLLFGSAGRDRAVGRRGDDALFGEGGPDSLLGGPGSDLLFGGARRDRLIGGPGPDGCNGGGGRDRARSCLVKSRIP